jgi:hypothetical protein
MYGQFNLEVISNLSKTKRRSSDLYEFWGEEVCCRKRLKKNHGV